MSYGEESQAHCFCAKEDWAISTCRLIYSQHHAVINSSQHIVTMAFVPSYSQTLPPVCFFNLITIYANGNVCQDHFYILSLFVSYWPTQASIQGPMIISDRRLHGSVFHVAKLSRQLLKCTSRQCESCELITEFLLNYHLCHKSNGSFKSIGFN